MDLDYDIEEKIKDLTIEPQYLRVEDSEPIGRGNFGIIYMGQLLKDEKCVTVAVKTLRGGCAKLANENDSVDKACLQACSIVAKCAIIRVRSVYLPMYHISAIL